MGGNTKAINRETGEVVNVFGRPGYADKLDFKAIDRSEFKRNVIATLKKLDNFHKSQFGMPIWNPKTRDKILNSGEAFNGSSEHLFKDSITDDEFTKYKPSVGDIDLTVPSENIETIFELLSSLEGSEILQSKMWYVGQNRKTFSGDQINALFAYKEAKDQQPIFIQIDFEAVDYLNGKPSEFAKFSHSSSWEDVKTGVKGVFHKYVIRSLTIGSLLDDAILLTKSSPLYPPEKLKIARKADPIRLLSFSVSSGMRATVELQKYADDATVPPELVGKPVKFDGKFVYKELSTGESTYTKSKEEIFTLIFGELPSKDDLILLDSFIGVLSLMKKYLSDEEIDAVYEDFINDKLFGIKSQRLDLTNPEIDKSSKMSAVGRFREAFPFLPEIDQSMLDSYYGSYKVRQTEYLKRYIKAVLYA
jgi:hypothetical protein